MYYKGLSVRQDYSKAAQWFEKAANEGKANTQYNLGLMYYRGEGVRLSSGLVVKEQMNLTLSNYIGDQFQHLDNIQNSVVALTE